MAGGLDGLTQRLMAAAAERCLDLLRNRKARRRVYVVVLCAHGEQAAISRAWDQMNPSTLLAFSEALHREAAGMEHAARTKDPAFLSGGEPVQGVDARLINGGV